MFKTPNFLIKFVLNESNQYRVQTKHLTSISYEELAGKLPTACLTFREIIDWSEICRLVRHISASMLNVKQESCDCQFLKYLV